MSIIPSLVVTATLALSGCGYTIRAPFDKRIRTVFVPMLKSQTFRRDLNNQLTMMIQQEIGRRTPYKVVSRLEEADTVLEGTIAMSDKNIVVESPFNLPRELNATIFVSVKWVHNPLTDEDREKPPTVVSELVNFVPEIGETAMTAFYRANQGLANQIVDMMEIPWYTESDLK